MNEILQQANLLKTGEIFELITPFIPAPIIDILKTKRYRIYSVQKENCVINYIIREA
jgi:hypothetical protein